MHLQPKMVQLSSSHIPNFNGMLNNTKEENINFSTSQQWKVQTSVSLQNILNEQHNCLLISHTYKKMVMYVTGKTYLTVSRRIYVFFQI